MILANHGIISSSGGVNPVLLDVYSGAASAYSLRKLKTAISPNAIKVRRSSDSTSQDIGFDVNGNLDTSSLLSFVGAGDGFVTHFFDQSGNSNHLVQGTASRQPTIVSGGSLITKNGKPSIYFSGDLLQASRVFSTSDFSIFSTLSGISNQSDAVTICQHAGGADLGRTVFVSPNDSASPYNKVKTFFNNGTSYSLTSTNVFFDDNLKLINITSNGSGTTTQHVNSSQESILTGQTWTPLNTSFSVGGLGNLSSFFTGYISEIVCYTTNQITNKTGIENNINANYLIY